MVNVSIEETHDELVVQLRDCLIKLLGTQLPLEQPLEMQKPTTQDVQLDCVFEIPWAPRPQGKAIVV
jgi:hypothetical protein